MEDGLSIWRTFDDCSSCDRILRRWKQREGGYVCVECRKALRMTIAVIAIDLIYGGYMGWQIKYDRVPSTGALEV